MAREKTVLRVRIPYHYGVVKLDVLCPRCGNDLLYFDPDNITIYCTRSKCNYEKSLWDFLDGVKE